MATVYEINKGINRPLEFKGIKAQYILFLAVGLVVLLVLFAVMYIIGVPVFICIPFILFAGFLLISRMSKFSREYGAHGLMKKAAYRKVPVSIRIRSRRAFRKLVTCIDSS